ELSPAETVDPTAAQSVAPQDESAPARARRAPRRTGGRARKSAPPAEPVSEVIAPEPQTEAPSPPPRRRRTRKSAEPSAERAVASIASPETVPEDVAAAESSAPEMLGAAHDAV